METSPRSRLPHRPLRRSFPSRLALPFLTLLLSHSASAEWSASGTSITTNIQQGQQKSVPDGAGGVIVVWTENRSGTIGNDIVAQRFDSAGNPQWGVEGAPICRATGDQSFPTAVTDQAGGAVFLWRDGRAGNNDIYAQRVNAAGTPLWAVDGVAVATGPLGDQVNPVAVNIGVAQTAFAYTDIDAAAARGVFVQAIDGTGATLWGAGGVPVSAVRGQDNPDITDDGTGGITVVWRTTGIIGDLFAQRFTGAGAPVWAAGGVPVCVNAANQLEPRIARVGGAGFFIVWQDLRGADADIFTQRLTPAAGAPFFAIDGIAICAAAGAQRHAIVSNVFAPFALYVWEDARNLADFDLYGQILFPPNFLAPAWGVNGAPLVVKPGDQTGAQVQFRPGTGGGIDLAWIDGPDGDVYAQRFDSTPTSLWAAGGVPLCTAPGTQATVALVSGASNLFTAVWADLRDGSTAYTFGQSIDDLGTPLWATNGVSATRRTLGQGSVVAAASGDGGVITAWIGLDRGEFDIYAEKLDARGVRLWNAKGNDVCTAVGAQTEPAIAADGGGGALVAWIDWRGGGAEIYVQRMASTGTPMWAADGVLVCAAPGSKTGVRVVSDGAGGAILAWSDSRVGPDRDVYVQHVNSLGAPVLAIDGIPLCAVAGDQDQIAMVSYLNGEAVVAWVDHRGADVDIYAHRLNAAGVPDPGWPAGGAPICIAAGDQDQLQISKDLVVVWRDARGPNRDIYAQSINPGTGAGFWAVNGLVVCNVAGDEEGPQIVSSPAGVNAASIVTWVDLRRGAGFPSIFAQRLLSNGTSAWQFAGIAVCTAIGGQSQLTIASDVSGGAVIAWQDSRALTGDGDIYAQRVNSSGTSLWTANGLAVCTAGGNQAGPIVVSDGAGGGIVAWQDSRDPINRGYAMRIAPQGGLYPTGVAETPRSIHSVRNRPNPFNPVTTIDYVLSRAGRVQLDIFDSRGRLLIRLVDRDEAAGPHSVIWNGLDGAGRPMATGVYHCRLEGLGGVETRKMVLAR